MFVELDLLDRLVRDYGVERDTARVVVERYVARHGVPDDDYREIEQAAEEIYSDPTWWD